jgi:hypothetical protein
MAFPAKFGRLLPRRGRSNFDRNYCYRGLITCAGVFVEAGPNSAPRPPQPLRYVRMHAVEVGPPILVAE